MDRKMIFSPFANDPSAIVAVAFRELYPDARYYAQLVPDLKDEDGNTAYGSTLFPNDGSDPIVSVSADVLISDEPELLAHELAHVSAGSAAEHGPEWEAAFEAIFNKYNEIIKNMKKEEPTI